MIANMVYCVIYSPMLGSDPYSLNKLFAKTLAVLIAGKGEGVLGDNIQCGQLKPARRGCRDKHSDPQHQTYANKATYCIALGGRGDDLEKYDCV